MLSLKQQQCKPLTPGNTKKYLSGKNALSASSLGPSMNLSTSYAVQIYAMRKIITLHRSLIHHAVSFHN
jgi:hypothetical protein